MSRSGTEWTGWVGGPLLADRLRGRAQAIAMNLRLPTPHGGMDIGDAALIRLPVDRVEGPTTGEVIQHPIASGAQALLSALRAAFGEAEQLLATKALETFFEFRRGRLTLPDSMAAELRGGRDPCWIGREPGSQDLLVLQIQRPRTESH